MAILFEIYRDGRDYSCTADGGPKFFVGRRVSYEDYIGLYNIFGKSPLEKLNYDAADFEAMFGFWATFIEPTAFAEGRNFLTLNTYDRAYFTFGFGQLAAHVAGGDFVQYFRAMLQLPNAADYFPHLGVVNGHICQTDTNPPNVLEDDQSSAKLKTYLNPGLTEVEDREVIAAAKFIHWTSTTQAARDQQVHQMVTTFRDHMRTAQRRVALDGVTADCCCVIADILHHGRNRDDRWPLIDSALKSTKPLKKLLQIGLPKWDERVKTLGSAIAARPTMATMRWSTAQNDFV